MFQVAQRSADIQSVPRLDTLAACVVIGPVATPRTVTAAYERVLDFAPDFRIALIEGMFRALDGCAGWTYVDRADTVSLRKNILIAAEAVAHGELLKPTASALNIRTDYLHTVLRAISMVGTAAYRLPTAEPWHRVSADLDVRCYTDDAVAFDVLVSRYALLPTDLSGYVARSGYEEHNARVALRQAAAAAIALKFRAEGIDPCFICTRLNLPPELRAQVEDAIRLSDSPALRRKTPQWSASNQKRS
jgi:hypothetical protein